MAKRQYIKKLPRLLRTDTEKKFFSATVDQLLSPRKNETLDGYIGRRIGGEYDPINDMYVNEPSADRMNYQLEPVALSKDSDTFEDSNEVFYEDFLNKLKFYDGKINNHDRLFDTSYYSWAPPIDVDKFINFHNYFWVPSMTYIPAIEISGMTEAQIETLIIGEETFNTNDASAFPENLQFTSGLVIKFVDDTGSNLAGIYQDTKYSVEAVGRSIILVEQQSNILPIDQFEWIPWDFSGEPGVPITNTFDAKNDVDFVSNIITINDHGYTNGDDVMLSYTTGVPPSPLVNGSVYYVSVINENQIKIAETQTRALSNYTLSLSTGEGTMTFTEPYINGTGSEPWDSLPWDAQIADISNDYITMERGACDKNAWSRTNGWVHSEVLQVISELTGQSALTYATRAKRPIIEFVKNLEIYNSGTEFLTEVDFISEKSYDSIEGASIDNATVYVDRIPLYDGATIVFRNTNEGIDPADVNDYVWQVNFNEALKVINLTKVITAIDDDLIVIATNGRAYKGFTLFKDNSEETVKWQIASSQKLGTNQAPLFQLYDCAGNSLSDASLYPDTNFAGSEIFSYKINEVDTRKDDELGFVLEYSGLGKLYDIVFENDLETERYTYVVDNIIYNIDGYYYFNFMDPDTDCVYDPKLRSSWVPSEIDSKQRVIDRYVIKDVGVISSNTFNALTDVDVATNNIEILGHRYSDGNRVKLINEVGTIPEPLTNNTLYYVIFVDENTIRLAETESNALLGIEIDILNLGDGPINLESTEGNREYTTSVLPYQSDVIVKLNGQLLIVDEDYILENSTVSFLTPVVFEIDDVIEFYTYSKEASTETFMVYDVEQKHWKLSTTPDYVDIDVVGSVSGPMSDFKIIDDYVVFGDSVIPLSLGETLTFSYVSSVNLSDEARGYYEIPQALENNPGNEEVSEQSYNDLTLHFLSIIENQTNVQGSQLSEANLYRDSAKDPSVGEHILQNETPAIKAMFATSTKDIDVVDSMRFASQEYVRFKNKFLKIVNEMDTSGEFNNLTSPDNKVKFDTWFNEVITRVNCTSEVIDSFNNTHMIAIGSVYQEEIITLDINNTVELTIYDDITDIRNNLYIYAQDTDISPQLGENLLLETTDYEITSYNPIVIKFNSSKATDPTTDNIYARIYSNPIPSHIPSTPSKLGMYKVWVPRKFNDFTVPTPNSSIGAGYILGHDGSKTNIYGDIRDKFLLELEYRIYNSICQEFKGEYQPLLTVDDVYPGKFRDTNYTVEEINDILKTSFSKWANRLKLNWRENDTYNLSDEWTYNYTGNGIHETNTPGYWRGIFRFYYDTDTPHTNPWEMLGFANMPDWWQIASDDGDGFTGYGSNYGSSNTAMWDDLEAGLIRRGSRKGVDEKYIRNNLVSAYLPVDGAANLLSPFSIGLVSYPAFDSDREGDWLFGDLAPIEKDWANSSYYAFAIMELLYLTKPAKFGEYLWNTKDFVRSVGIPEQVVSDETCKRPKNSEQYVHEETVNNVIQIRLGYQQWISDRLSFLKKEIKSEFGDKIRNLDVKLGHKMAGYTIYDNFKLFVEGISPSSSNTSELLPTESSNIKIFKSPPTEEYVYSGVVVRALDNGKYQIYGYDLLDFEFKYFPPHPNEKGKEINVGGKPANYRYFSVGSSYRAGEFVNYNTVYYRAKTDFTATRFDSSQWTKLANLPVTGGVETTYYRYRDSTIENTIVYGHIFDTMDETFDFIIGYGAWLEDKGWKFETFDKVSNSINDFLKAGKDYLFWVATAWSVDNVITLSPGASKPTLEVKFGYPESVERTTNGVYSILDEHGVLIDPRLTSINRDDRKLEVIPKNPDIRIYYLRVNVSETEHIVLIDNVTSFNDVIYQPLLGLRQARLEISATRTLEWFGKYEAQGYLITEDKNIVPNIENTTESIRRYHDTETSLDTKRVEETARHLIGAEEKNYLVDLQLDDDVQYQFYQGQIREKGTEESIKKLLRSTYVTQDHNIFTYEEWALLVSEFGGICQNQHFDISLKVDDIKTDPQLLLLDTPKSRTGHIKEIIIVNAITKYEEPPFVTIVKGATDKGNGCCASAVAILDRKGYITRIDVVNPGLGYIEEPLIYFGESSWDKDDEPWDTMKWDIGYGDCALSILELDIIEDNPDDDVIVIDIDDTSRWIYRPRDCTAVNLIPVTTNKQYDMPNAGYGNLNDVDFTAFDMDIFNNLWDSTKNYTPRIHQTATIDPDNPETLSQVTDVRISVPGVGYSVGDILESDSGTVVSYSQDTTYVVTSVRTVQFQDETDFDGVGANGTFDGGTGYIVGEELTLIDGSTITVDTVSTGIITEFTVTYPSTSSLLQNATLSQSTSTDAGVGFSVTLGNNNQEIDGIEVELSGIYSEPPDERHCSVTGGTGTGATVTNTIFTTDIATWEDGKRDTVWIANGINTDWGIYRLFDTGMEYRTDYEFDQNDTGGILKTVVRIDADINDLRIVGSTIVLNVKHTIQTYPLQTEIVNTRYTLAYLEDAETTSQYRAHYQLYSETGDPVRFDPKLIETLNGVDYNLNLWQLANVRFETLAHRDKTDVIDFQVGEFTWIDSNDNGLWEVQVLVDDEPTWETLTLVYDVNGVTTLIPRLEDNLVDTHKFAQGFLYDTYTEETSVMLPIYDPFKDLIPGVADQNISYKSEIDPSRYSSSPTESLIDRNNMFGYDQIGDLWWDLNDVRYLYYEQGTNRERRDLWGRLFPGSKVNVYEWTRSLLKPEYYLGEGTPKNLTDYAEYIEYDTTLNKEVNVYYFWVSGKTSIPDLPNRTLSAQGVSLLLTDPRNQNYQWISPVNYHSNEAKFTRQRENFKLPIDVFTYTMPVTYFEEYEVSKAGDLLVENVDFTLLQNVFTFSEDLAQSDIQIDYLTYTTLEDRNAFVFNNINEEISNKEQSLQVNYTYSEDDVQTHAEWHLVAEDNETSKILDQHWNKMVDSVLGQTDIIEWSDDVPGFCITTSGYGFLMVPDPTLSEAEKYGTKYRPRQTWFKDILESRKVFVNKINSLLQDICIRDQIPEWEEVLGDENGTWKWVTWYEDGYDSTNSAPSRQVETVIEMTQIKNLLDGDIIKVLPDETVSYTLYEYDADTDTFSIIAREDCTVEIQSSVYEEEATVMLMFQLRDVIEFVEEFVFIEDDLDKKNYLFFTMLNQAMTNDRNHDWVFKTTYLLLKQSGLPLTQERYLQPDIVENTINYVNSIKPYRTKVRDYILSRNAGIELGIGTATELKNLHITLKYDRVACASGILDASLVSAGSRHKIGDIIYLVDNNNGSGAEAKITAVDLSNGAITEFEIVNAGTGYNGSRVYQTATSGTGTGFAIDPVVNLDCEAVDRIRDAYSFEDPTIPWDSDMWDEHLWDESMTINYYTGSDPANDVGALEGLFDQIEAKQSVIANGTDSTFSLTFTPTPYESPVSVFLNNVQYYNFWYNTDTNSITFIDTPALNDVIEIYDVLPFNANGFLQAHVMEGVPEELAIISPNETMVVTASRYPQQCTTRSGGGHTYWLAGIDIDISTIEVFVDDVQLDPADFQTVGPSLWDEYPWDPNICEGPAWDGEHGVNVIVHTDAGQSITFQYSLLSGNSIDPFKFKLHFTAEGTQAIYRLCDNMSGILATDVSYADDEIELTSVGLNGFNDADLLNPGYIWIGSELVAYHEIEVVDPVNQVFLRNLVRGYNNTTADSHLTDDIVFDAKPGNVMRDINEYPAGEEATNDFSFRQTDFLSSC